MIKALWEKMFTGSRGSKASVAYSAREVWLYAHTDPKSGRVSERPVLVFHKASEGMFWGLPLSRMRVKESVLYVPRLKNGKKVPALSQMRTLKAGRLVRRLGVAGEKEFTALNTSVLRMLAFAPRTSVAVRPVHTPRPRVAVRPMRPAYAHTFSSFTPYVLQPR